MTNEQRLANRKQLKQCFMDLGDRALELKEPCISSLCYVIAASIAEGSDEFLAIWNAEFAKMRLEMEDKGLDKNN